MTAGNRDFKRERGERTERKRDDERGGKEREEREGEGQRGEGERGRMGGERAGKEKEREEEKEREDGEEGEGKRERVVLQVVLDYNSALQGYIGPWTKFLLRIMHQVQDRSLYLLTCSPTRHHYATAASVTKHGE